MYPGQTNGSAVGTDVLRHGIRDGIRLEELHKRVGVPYTGVNGLDIVSVQMKGLSNTISCKHFIKQAQRRAAAGRSRDISHGVIQY